MEAGDDESADERELMVELLDPLVRRVFATSDPHDTYLAATDIAEVLGGFMDVPDGDMMYLAWSDLADVFETGRTPEADAAEAVRKAAKEWLACPDSNVTEFWQEWGKGVSADVGALYSRDGDFWTIGEVGGCPYWLPVDSGGRVTGLLGDGMPIMQDAFRDSLGTRPEPAQVHAIRRRLDRAIRELGARTTDARSTPFARGSTTYLRVSHGVVEAGYVEDAEGSGRVEMAPIDEVMAMLLAWRRIQIQVSPEAGEYFANGRQRRLVSVLNRIMARRVRRTAPYRRPEEVPHL